MVKLLIKIFYLATVITTSTTTISSRIAVTNNVEYNSVVFCNVKYNSVVFRNVKYDNVVFCNVKYDNITFCLQKHPTNSITCLEINIFYGVYILNSVLAPN